MGGYIREQHERNTRTVSSHSRKMKIQGHHIIVIMIIKGTSIFFSLTDERDCLSFSLPLLNLNLWWKCLKSLQNTVCTVYTHTYMQCNIQSKSLHFFLSNFPVSSFHFTTYFLFCHPSAWHSLTVIQTSKKHLTSQQPLRLFLSFHNNIFVFPSFPIQERLTI